MLSILAISDRHAGHWRQARALADALAGAQDTVADLIVQAKWPWRWLAPYWIQGPKWAFAQPWHQVWHNPPALVVGCGRQAALATRLLRRRGATAIQILHPHLSPKAWDFLVVPEHDGLAGETVLTLLGSLNPVDDTWLAQGREHFSQLAQFPPPRVAVLLGGPTAQVPWSESMLLAYGQQLRQLVATRGSLMITVSARTPTSWMRSLARVLSGHSCFYYDPASGQPNPYAGILGWADAVVVTGDSVNLVSEACATRVPVAVICADGARHRQQRFLTQLRQRQRVVALDRLLDRAMADGWLPLRETASLAQTLRQRLSGIRRTSVSGER